MSGFYKISLTDDYNQAALTDDYSQVALTEDYYKIYKGPVIQSAEVGNVDDNDLVITFSKNLNTSIVPNVNDFVVNDGAANAVTSVSISGATVTLVLTNDVGIGATVVVSYTPAWNALRDNEGNLALGFSLFSVTNNVSGSTYVSSEVGDVANNILVMTYDLALDESSIPAGSDFAVNDGSANAVTNVAISTLYVTLTLTNDVDNGDTVVVSYTKGTNPIQDLDGTDSLNLTNESVTNNVVSFVAQYQAIYDQFSTTPSSADAAAQNTFVKSLVDDGVWDELDFMFIFASHAMGADALLNWINPTGTAATLVNAPTGTQYQGYISDGSTSYINTNWDAATNGVNYIQNSNTYGVYCRTSIQEDRLVCAVNKTSGAKDFTYIYIARSAISQTQSWNNSAGVGNAFNNTNSQGLFQSNRTDGTNMSIYHNGVQKDTTAATAATLSTLDFYCLALNTNGSANNFTNNQVSLFFAGSNLSAKASEIYNAFQTLMTYYGTNV
jgi:uncharacterized repeat protein (TIGR02059 family)